MIYCLVVCTLNFKIFSQSILILISLMQRLMGDEIVIYEVWMMLNLHLDCVLLQVNVCNVFNLMSWSTIFFKLWFLFGSLNDFFSFVQWLYAYSSPSYSFQTYQHGDFIIILLKSATQHGGPIGRIVVYYGWSLQFLIYSSNPPYLGLPFVGRWYACNRSCIRRDSYFLQLQ